MAPCPRPLFASLSLLLLLQFVGPSLAQRSFADTKFELPADLPAEELLPPISASQDQQPAALAAGPGPVPPPATPGEPVAGPTPSSSPLPPPANPTPNPKTPLPSLPTLIDLPKFVEGGNVQLITVPPSLVESGNQSSPSPQAPGLTLGGLAPAQPNPPHPAPIGPAPLAKTPPSFPAPVGSRTAQKPKQKPHPGPGLGLIARNWFREEFDTKSCPRSAEQMAKQLQRKFPRNLLKQKETVLAELLAIKWGECLRKQAEDHWALLDSALQREEGLAAGKREREECRAGLIQEQIACMNVHSFACQFIQPSFQFRLVPTRLIVQEARLAEDGAEKCKKYGRDLFSKGEGPDESI